MSVEVRCRTHPTADRPQATGQVGFDGLKTQTEKCNFLLVENVLFDTC